MEKENKERLVKIVASTVLLVAAILISKTTNRISIRPITDLIVSGPTPVALGF